MNEQILNVNIFPFSFKNNKTYNKKHIPKLIDKNSIYSWNFWKENIFEKSYVNFSKDNDKYSNEKYQLYTWKWFLTIFEDIKQVYINRYNNLTKWYNKKHPILNNGLWKQDPTFIQRVTIKNNKAKVLLIGDIHSGFHSLHNIILKNRHLFKGDTLTLYPDNYIIFLGDLVDRGPYNLEVLLFVFILTIKNPNNVYIINGNHEDWEMYSKYGTSDEIKHQFSTELTHKDSDFGKLMFFLPSAIYLDYNNKMYHLSHGAFDLKYSGFNKDGKFDNTKQSKLFDFLNSGKEFDLLKMDGDYTNSYKWGDLYQDVEHFERVDGSRHKFGKGIIRDYLSKHKIQSIIGGHQDLVNFGLIDINSNNKFKYVDGVTLIRAKESKYISDYFEKYDFYIPENLILHEVNFDELKNISFVLKEGEYHALVTSTASITKGLNYNSFLLLETKYKSASKRKLGQFGGLAEIKYKIFYDL
jgi:hypothetical protein